MTNNYLAESKSDNPPSQLYKITHNPTGLIYYRFDLEKR